MSNVTYPGNTDSELIWADVANAGQLSGVAWVTSGNGKTSDYLTASDFSAISIPDGATIDGLTIQIERDADIAGEAVDKVVQVVIDGTPGTNVADVVTYYPTSSATATYGGAENKLGHASITPADLADLSIRFAQESDYNADPAGVIVNVTRIALIVHYTEAIVGSILRSSVFHSPILRAASHL